MKTYKIEELSPEAKKVAIEGIKADSDFNDREVDLDWLIEGQQEELEDKFGLDNVEISFSGFWSQGDGASFTGKVSDIPMFMKAIGIDTSNIPDKAMEAIPEVFEMYIVRTQSRYFHENTVRFEIENIDDTELVLLGGFGLGEITIDLNDVLVDVDFESKASKWVKDKSREIYDKLERAYYEEFSDEVAEIWADNSELEFDEKGNNVNN